MLFHPSWMEMQLISQKLKEICLFYILQLRFIDTVLERQPKLRRQRCIFTKERGTNTKAPKQIYSDWICVSAVKWWFDLFSLSGKNFLRAAQMNMNFATWGHLMMSILPRYSSFTTFSSSFSATPDLVANNAPHATEKEPQTTTSLPRYELIISSSHIVIDVYFSWIFIFIFKCIVPWGDKTFPVIMSVVWLQVLASLSIFWLSAISLHFSTLVSVGLQRSSSNQTEHHWGSALSHHPRPGRKHSWHHQCSAPNIICACTARKTGKSLAIVDTQVHSEFTHLYM